MNSLKICPPPPPPPWQHEGSVVRDVRRFGPLALLQLLLQLNDELQNLGLQKSKRKRIFIRKVLDRCHLTFCFYLDDRRWGMLDDCNSVSVSVCPKLLFAQNTKHFRLSYSPYFFLFYFFCDQLYAR